MNVNTIRTAIGFFRSFVERRIPLSRKKSSVEDIYNYVHIENLFSTSGQPSETEFGLIRDAGYKVVINLAPTSVLENAVVNEREILSDLGIKYVHIPVDFKNPTEADFEKFVSNLRENSEQKVWVHCAANMRVSAFTYRYRRSVLKVDERTAEVDLHKIWDPIGAWKGFIKP
jgi:protein tyrosine phosphatase (PTP) superfamily phosphohydrolase (DUF442 family)